VAGNRTIPSTSTGTTTSNATLSGTNYNAVAWAAVTAAANYYLLRTPTNVTPTTGGATLVGSTTALTLNDTANATGSFTVPARNATGDELVDGVLTATGGLTNNGAYAGTAVMPIANGGIGATTLLAAGIAALGGNNVFTQPVATSGSPVAFTLKGAAHTTLAAGVEDTDVLYDLSATKQFAAGAITINRDMQIKARTLSAFAATTIATAVTLDISGPPIAGTNVVITTPLALRVGGTLIASNNVRCTGQTNAVPAGGAIEMTWSGASGCTRVYDWVGDTYYPLQLNGSTVSLGPGGTAAFTAAATVNTNAVPMQMKSYTVATLPATPAAGLVAYASNAAASPCLCFGNGSVWKRCDAAATTVV
jgi:hypothetical protein